jgi:hypothetical protein
MTEADDLLAAWRATDAALPAGWHLDALRCASTGLDPASRCDDWVAAAAGPGGARLQRRSASAAQALAELASALGTDRHDRSRG